MGKRLYVLRTLWWLTWRRWVRRRGGAGTSAGAKPANDIKYDVRIAAPIEGFSHSVRTQFHNDQVRNGLTGVEV
jgi:hypothetical protein